MDRDDKTIRSPGSHCEKSMEGESMSTTENQATTSESAAPADGPAANTTASATASDSHPQIAENNAAKQPKFQLGTPIQFVPGVGGTRAPLFEKLGLPRAGNLLFYFPRDYLPPVEIVPFSKLKADTRVSVVGTVIDREFRGASEGRSVAGVLLQIEGGAVRLKWFNQPYRLDNISHGAKIQATGVIKMSGFVWEIVHPEYKIIDDEEELAPNKPVPQYSLTEGLLNHHVKRVVHHAVSELAESVEEVLPSTVRELGGILGIGDALKQIHIPATMDDAMNARKRFIFQELLVLQLALALRKRQRLAGLPAPMLEDNAKIHNRILSRFPFELTHDQRQAITDVANDMGRNVPMNRLIQGDVGSGKTVVAMYAMLLAVAHGYQAALMAPTEVLARQHARVLGESLKASRVNVELLTGSLSGSERKSVLDSVAMGTTDLVIGTQALLSDQLEFRKLGVVIVDEQHRFGVGQRASLRSGSETQPHYLVLTATPIPRTIAMTLFGDLDVSVLREKPPGRTVTKSYVARQDEMASWWEFVRKQLQQGRQAYVVAPRVEDNEQEESRGAEYWYDRLQREEFASYRVGLLHGRMSANEKDETLRKFNAHELDLLVSTTVIEVGIDVANATVMTVMEADRLGLAQLHQLRGRVGRGKHPGYFCVFPRKESPGVENERLSALTKTQDGFELAEIDFKIRGPGNLMGTKQHGLPPMRIADLNRDTKLLEHARKVALQVVAENPELEGEEFRRLKKQVLARYGANLELGDVG
jgi:ATP-dependent DNA helicase RecG